MQRVRIRDVVLNVPVEKNERRVDYLLSWRYNRENRREMLGKLCAGRPKASFAQEFSPEVLVQRRVRFALDVLCNEEAPPELGDAYNRMHGGGTSLPHVPLRQRACVEEEASHGCRSTE